MRKRESNLKTQDFETKELIEYHMSRRLADALLSGREKSEKKAEPQKYLIEYINREFGLKGTCISVIYD